MTKGRNHGIGNNMPVIGIGEQLHHLLRHVERMIKKSCPAKELKGIFIPAAFHIILNVDNRRTHSFLVE